MDPDNDAPRDASWPPPHPSPPLPPPREYGAPGTEPSRHPWLVGLLAAVAIGAVVGAVFVVRSLGGGGDDSDAEPTERPSAAGSSTRTPGPTAAPAAAVSCWDGSAADQVAQCSRPEGAAGLAWVFPRLADQKCGAPTQAGPGVALRILCVDRLADGTRVQVGYYQWQSVRAGIGFYDGQGLSRSDEGEVHRWTGRSGDTVKSALLYAHAPFSLTVTLPAAAQDAPDAPALIAVRPPEQLRGVPAG